MSGYPRDLSGRALGQRRDSNPVPGPAASAKPISAERECEPVFQAPIFSRPQARPVATKRTAPHPNTRPSHELADYVGDYGHPGYGRITITHAEGKLNWAYRGMSEPIAHRHYDTFELPEAPGRLLPDRLPISFSTDREGNIASLGLRSSRSSKTSSSPGLQPAIARIRPSVSTVPARSTTEARLLLSARTRMGN
jgi:hypothetical protein